jgi:uncharacterized protein YbjQ (UPF0145 family)
MLRTNDILVSTTQNFENCSIKQYLKPVSAHIVAGTNFFSDVFASFSDVFGGRSKTYQRQLASIYVEAIDTLKNAAVGLGANGVVGLKIDLDEISGKGKSMFMITAVGTAVIVDAQNANMHDSKTDVMTVEKMNVLREKNDIIQSITNDRFRLNSSAWEFITKNGVYEVANEVCKIMFNPVTSASDGMHEMDEKKSMLYFLSLETDFMNGLFYEILMSDEYQEKKKIRKFMKDLMIYDFDKLQHYLQSDNAEYRRKAVQVAALDKQTFSNDDIARYENLIQIMEAKYKETCTYSTEKKFMSSKDKDVWICQCQHKNNMDDEYCGKCYKDRFGYASEDIEPKTAVKRLKANIEMIKQYFSE